MTCSNCAQRVSEALQAVPGVIGAEADAASGRAVVTWSSASAPNIDALLHAVERAGYKATLNETTDAHDHSHVDAWKLNLIVGGALTLPLMLGEWVFHLGHANWFLWLSFVQAGIVQLVCGARFYRGAWQQAKVGASNMDTLVALGTTTAFGYSVWQLFTGATGHLFFMEAAATITLISLGHWLEGRISKTPRARCAACWILRRKPRIDSTTKVTNRLCPSLNCARTTAFCSAPATAYRPIAM